MGNIEMKQIYLEKTTKQNKNPHVLGKSQSQETSS